MDTNSLSQSLDSVNTAVSVAGEEEVRTLFVSGLPMDTKPRELYLLFRAYEKRWVQPSSTPGQTSGPTLSTSPAPSSSSSSSSRLCWVIRPCINNYQSDHFSDSTTNTLMVSPEPCITWGQFFNVLFQVKGWRKSYTHSNKARWLSWGILAKLNLINSHCEKSKLAGGALAPHSTNTL